MRSRHCKCQRYKANRDDDQPTHLAILDCWGLRTNMTQVVDRFSLRLFPCRFR
jgi:hypothetical protein